MDSKVEIGALESEFVLVSAIDLDLCQSKFQIVEHSCASITSHIPRANAVACNLLKLTRDEGRALLLLLLILLPHRLKGIFHPFCYRRDGRLRQRFRCGAPCSRPAR